FENAVWNIFHQRLDHFVEYLLAGGSGDLGRACLQKWHSDCAICEPTATPGHGKTCCGRASRSDSVAANYDDERRYCCRSLSSYAGERCRRRRAKFHWSRSRWRDEHWYHLH